MAANPSKIAALASTQADKSNNDSRELAKAKQEKESKDAFEQFQFNLFDSNPAITSLYAEEFRPFSIFPRELNELTISYLMGNQSKHQSGTIPRPILHSYADHEINKMMTLVSKELLPHVFGANPDGVDAFLRTPDVHPKMLLTESPFADGFDSRKSKGFVCFRRYRKMSALKGAYRTGDGPFLGRRILAYLLRDNNLPDNVKEGFLCEARKQLTELLERIATPVGTKTVNIKTSVATNVATASLAAASTATTSSAATVNTNDTASNKEKAEFNSGSSANTNEFADDDEFLSAIVQLINAYNAYTSQFDSLFKQNNSKEINRLWGEVCECHKRLYRYVHLEFFGPTPFSPVSPELFIAAPHRGACRYYNNDSFDLDEIGRDALVGLYKGVHRWLWGGVMAYHSWDWAHRGLPLDLAAISHLYKLRVDDLRNTIGQLHSLEAALTFLNDIKPQPRVVL